MFECNGNLPISVVHVVRTEKKEGHGPSLGVGSIFSSLPAILYREHEKASEHHIHELLEYESILY